MGVASEDDVVVTIEDIERLGTSMFDATGRAFYNSGIELETTLRENVAAFSRYGRALTARAYFLRHGAAGARRILFLPDPNTTRWDAHLIRPGLDPAKWDAYQIRPFPGLTRPGSGPGRVGASSLEFKAALRRCWCI